MNARHPSTRRAGFTVLELVVCVAIISLVAAVAIPAFSSDTERMLDTAQVAVQDALDYARDQAEQKGVPHGVHFADNGHMFGVVDPNGAVEDVLTRSLYIVDFEQPGQPTGVVVSYVNENMNPVAPYNEAGLLVVNGTLTLSFGGESRVLEVNPVNNELFDPLLQTVSGGGDPEGGEGVITN